MEVSLDVKSLKELVIVPEDSVGDFSRKYNALIEMLIAQNEVTIELREPVSPGLN